MVIINNGSIVFDSYKNEYQVVEFIDNGSFGNVFKTQSKNNNNIYALKTLPSSFASHNTISAFLNECKMAITIHHKNVVEYLYVHDGEVYQELPLYIIMEYCNQGNLKNFIQHQKLKGFPGNYELKSFMTDLCTGMQAINSKIIHRDIKPDNILIKDSVLKISDFGLSKIVTESTRTITFKGIGHTMYMAPEAWKYEKNTIQMDIYSMGLVFYELATLIHPYKISNIANIEEWKDAHFFQNPERPELINGNLNRRIAQVIMKMIAKDISNRYKNWDDIINDISSSEIAITKINVTQKILEKRLELDNKIEKKKLEEENRANEIKEFQKKVFYQFNNDIISPIKEFIEAFNFEYLNGKIKLSSSTYHGNRLEAIITLISNNKINIVLRTLIDEEFYRQIKHNDFGEVFIKRELRRPKLGDSLIIAWGIVSAQNGKGFNILLMERKDSLYGSWLVLKNRSMALSTHQRLPEPFPFGFDEIEKELPFIKMGMHIYVTDLEEFNVKHVIDLIGEFN